MSDDARRGAALFFRYQRLVAERDQVAEEDQVVTTDEELERWAHAAPLLKAQRESMGLSLNALSTMMSGYPNSSRIAKIELGDLRPTALAAQKLAEALGLPAGIVLQSAGWATPRQQQEALDSWRRLDPWKR